MKLTLTKPIVFFDLETTGVLVAADRIVEISLIKILPDGRENRRTHRINPDMPIPPASTAIHGISDADVADAPKFADIAHDLTGFIGNADLAGFNVIKFDVPLLIEEFNRVGIEFLLENRRIVDVQNIFHKMEQRTLVAAYKFYCQKDLTNAHSSLADTEATYEVLLAMLDRYHDVEISDPKGRPFKPIVNEVGQLSKFSINPNHADLAGHIVIGPDGKELFNFGKHKGKLVSDVFKAEPSYYHWIMDANFPIDTKRLITKIKLEMKTSN